jgi:polyphosphate kinase
MGLESLLRLDISTEELLLSLADGPLPLGLTGSRAEEIRIRDVYYDTSDETLHKRDVTCRLRYGLFDRKTLIVTIREPADGTLYTRSRFSASTTAVEPRELFAGSSEPALVLRALADPEDLVSVMEIETERRLQAADSGRKRGGAFEFRYDRMTARVGNLAGTFFELQVRRIREGSPSLEQILEHFSTTDGLEAVSTDQLGRARRLFVEREVEVLEESVRASRQVAVVPFENGQIGFRCDGRALQIPAGRGSGEESCRKLLRKNFGSSQGQVRLLGASPSVGSRPALEVWLARRLPDEAVTQNSGSFQWVDINAALGMVGTPSLRDAPTLAALHVVARSDLMRERATFKPPSALPSGIRNPDLRKSELDPALPAAEQFNNANLSLLAFNARVLAMAEDPAIPLLERVRFLSIHSSNMDEFFQVQVGKRKRQMAEGHSGRSEDGLTAAEELDAIAIQARMLFERAHTCLKDQLIPGLGDHGIRILSWADVDKAGRKHLRDYLHREVFPIVTPLAASPGHPFPHISNLKITLAVTVRDPETAMEHFAAVRLPDGLPRFIQLPDSDHFVPLEAVMCANLQPLFPGMEFVRSHSFRVTRSGDVQYDEDHTHDLLQEIEEEVLKRPYNPVVRMEVERTMPEEVSELLMQEFRFETSDRISTLTRADLYEVDWLPDLSQLSELTGIEARGLLYPAFESVSPLNPGIPVLDQIAARDRLAHHPYESFEATVERFLVEAAHDPDVLAVKVSLYRTDKHSHIVDALLTAAEAGKEVVVMVEIKARYDEVRNIDWAKRLEEAGIHVVYGLLGLKSHAKVALVIRRESDGLRRYALVGTGNLNAATARFYTDLAFMTADPELGENLQEIFNALTGYSHPPEEGLILVSPVQMLDRFIELIDREAQHAREGRGGRIRVKVNGLADTEVIQALYRASQAGVEIDLIVRGICCLRPGIRGLSDRIRVISILGRFLEHARIYHFGNAGEDEYYIGSADWRPRNLRRRVEIASPIRDSALKSRLDHILTIELDDPTAWALLPEGSYERRSSTSYGEGMSTQERLADPEFSYPD